MTVDTHVVIETAITTVADVADHDLVPAHPPVTTALAMTVTVETAETVATEVIAANLVMALVTSPAPQVPTPLHSPRTSEIAEPSSANNLQIA